MCACVHVCVIVHVRVCTCVIVCVSVRVRVSVCACVFVRKLVCVSLCVCVSVIASGYVRALSCVGLQRRSSAVDAVSATTLQHYRPIIDMRQHPCNIVATSWQHRCNIAATSSQHRRNVLRHCCIIGATLYCRNMLRAADRSGGSPFWRPNRWRSLWGNPACAGRVALCRLPR